eukprot:scaffold54581_cov16-Tisochrysis_lutea.AAC.1
MSNVMLSGPKKTPWPASVRMSILAPIDSSRAEDSKSTPVVFMLKMTPGLGVSPMLLATRIPAGRHPYEARQDHRPTVPLPDHPVV